MATFHHHSFLLSIILVTLSAAGTAAVKFHIAAATPAIRSTFNRRIGIRYATQTMTTASSFLFKTFNQRDVADRKPFRNVTVSIDNSADHGLVVNNKNGTETNEFRIGVNCFSNVSSSTAAARRLEFSGLVYHYMTYVWGWNGGGKAPAGLMSGTADYVRWKAGFGLPEKAAGGAGERWDQGDDVTARFLDYCGGLKNGTTRSFVAEMNKLLKDGYSDGYFKQLLGKSVGDLWREYKNAVGKDGRFKPILH
ncbi:unnamed protein product [Linum tenue]|uniref:Uncharacterized protein n=3 Tax=Linum tenue TaxID=586396 RepID=A0AAV0MID7_9ROSI|nr:unnamed protein product [Linum tenue]